MIGCFPPPYPDELFYSICARYSDRVKYPSGEVVLQELFASTSLFCTSHFPHNIEHLVTQLPPGHSYTTERFINDHTLLPMFRPFLTQERTKQAYQALHAQNGIPVHRTLGIAKYPVYIKPRLRFCSECIVNDRLRFGECYWHRMHQVAGVDVCPVHRTQLIESAATIADSSYPRQFYSAESVVGKTALLLEPSSRRVSPREFTVRLTRDVAWLLRRRLPPDAPIALHTRYLAILNEEGLLGLGRSIRLHDLQARFLSAYPIEFLRSCSCEVEQNEPHSWISTLLNHHAYPQHPVRHLLLLQCLGYSVATFFQIPLVEKPFGDGPWPCLNRRSTHYRDLCIRECQVTTRQLQEGEQELRARFACDCGFVYWRAGPDLSPTDRFIPSQIESYGPEWEEQLQRLWLGTTLTYDQLFTRLCVPRQVIKQQVKKLGLRLDRPGGKGRPRKLIR